MSSRADRPPESPRPLRVRDIMTTAVITAAPDTPVHEIARLMDEKAISGVPVVEREGRLAGLVTDLDLIVRNTRFEPPAFFQLLDGRIPLETPGHYKKRLRHMLGTEARDVMTEKVETVGPDDEAEVLAERMVRRRANPVPVVEDGRLVGIVSRADLLRLMARGAVPTPTP